MRHGETQNPSCVKIPLSVMIWGGHVIVWCWSTVFYPSPKSTQPDVLFPSADMLYGDAGFILQQDLATLPKVPIPGLMTIGSLCLLDCKLT